MILRQTEAMPILGDKLSSCFKWCQSLMLYAIYYSNKLLY